MPYYRPVHLGVFCANDVIIDERDNTTHQHLTIVFLARINPIRPDVLLTEVLSQLEFYICHQNFDT